MRSAQAGESRRSALSFVRRWWLSPAAALLVALPSTALAQPDLVLNINESPDPVPRSGIVTYSVVIANNGVGNAGGVSFTMAVPSGSRYVAYTSGSGATCSGMAANQAGPGTITCTHPDLAFMATATFTIQLRHDLLGSTTVSSSTSTTDADADLANNSVTNTSTVIAGADASVTLTAAASAASGSTTSFTLGITNAGPDAASALRVQFPIPSGFTQTGSLPGGCSSASGTITCDVAGPIASGSSTNIGNISGIISVASGSTITGTASLTLQPSAPAGTAQDPNSSNNSATRSISVTAGSDVRLNISRSGASPYFVGGTFNFVLAPAYDGGVPSTLTMTDVLPANYMVGSVGATQNGWSCGVSGQTVTCTKATGTVAGYNVGLGSVTIPVTIITAGTVTNSATISAGSPTDPNPGNNTGTDGGTTLQNPTADLSISTGGPSPALAVVGGPFTWTITARNNGPSAFYGQLIVTDTVPAGVDITGITLNGWSCTPALPVSGPGVITCTRTYTSGSTLASGANAPAISLTATPTSGSVATNAVYLSTANANVVDPNTADKQATHTMTISEVPQSADLTIVKSVDLATVAAGDVLTYTVQVVNKGPATATNVTLTDVLGTLINSSIGATGAGYISHTVTVGVASAVNCTTTSGSNARTLSCTIPSLPVCTVDSDCPRVDIAIRPGGDGGTRTNTASVLSSSTADSTLANNSGSVSSTILARADIQVTQTATPDPVNAGQNLTIVLAAKDNGPSLASAVVVTDSLPIGVLFVSATPSSGSCTTTPGAGTITTALSRTLVCALGSVSNGAQKTVTVVIRPVTAMRLTSVTNDVWVTTTTTEPDTPGATNNSATRTVSINNPSLDLLINNTDSVDPVTMGSNTVYTVTVTNVGPSDAENVVVRDTLPLSGLSFQSATISAGSCSVQPAVDDIGGTLTCGTARLAQGTTLTLTITMKGVSKGIFTNIASVSSDEVDGGFDTNMANNRAVQMTTVRTIADMQVVSVVPSAPSVELRRPYSWTVTVRNNTGVGLAEADTARVSSSLPSGLELTGTPTITLVSGTTTLSTCTGVAPQTSYSCSLGTVSSGAEFTITVPVRQLTVPGGGTNSLTAAATTTSADAVPANNSTSGSVTITSSSVAGRVFRDFDNSGSVDAGDTGISGITMTLTGTAFDASAVSRTATTASDGTFTITGLPEGSYSVQRGTVSEAFLSVGQQVAGSAGGTATTPPSITAIALPGTTAATGYLWGYVPQARIGIAKRLLSTTPNTDGSITAALRFLVKNYSLEAVSSVVVLDSLSGSAPRVGTFLAGGAAAPLSSSRYTIQAAPSVFGTCANSTVDPTFDGESTPSVVRVSTLAANASCEFDVSVRYQPTDPLPGGNYSNSAVVTATGALSGQQISDRSQNGTNADPDADNNPTNNASVTPLAAVLTADVFTQLSTPASVNAGQSVSATVLYRNQGPYGAAGVSYTLTLSSGLGTVTFGNLPVGASASYNNTTGAVTFTGMPTTLAATVIASGNGTGPITVQYAQHVSGSSTVAATIATSTNEGANTAANSASATVTGVPIADVSTTVSAPTLVAPTLAVNTTIRFENLGPSTAAGVTYAVTLSTGLSGVTASNLPGGASVSYNSSNGALTFTGMPSTIAAGVLVSGDGVAPIGVTYAQSLTTSSIVGRITTTTNQGANAAPDTAAASVLSIPIADVTTTATLTSPVNAGALVTGTVVYRNTGPSTAAGVSYTLTLNAALSGVLIGNLPAGASASYNAATGDVTLANMPASLAVNAIASGDGVGGITVRYVQRGSASSSLLSRIGTVTSQWTNALVDSATATSTGALVADVRTQLTAPVAVNAALPLTATITFGNLGPSIASGLTYRMTLPSGLAAPSFTNLPVGASASYIANSGLVTFAGMPAALDSGAIASANGSSGIVVTYAQSPTGQSQITGAIGTTTSQGANIAVDSAAASVGGVPVADVYTSFAGFPTFEVSGALVSGWVIYRNAGPSTATGMTYGLQLAAGLADVGIANLPAGASASYSSATGVVTLTNMPTTLAAGAIAAAAGQSGILVQFRLASAGVRLHATIGTTTLQDPNTQPDVGDALVDVLGAVDLAVTKTMAFTEVSPGERISYRLRASNVGTRDVPAGARLTDEPSTGLTLVSASCASSPTNRCVSAPLVAQLATGVTLPAMPVGATYELLVDATVASNAPSVIRNEAVLAPPSGSGDVDLSNNRAVAGPTPVRLFADLSLRKTLLASPTAGTVAHYALTVRNVGTANTAAPIQLTDRLPSGLTFVSATGDGWRCVGSGAPVSCTRDAPLTVGNESTVLLDARVDVDRVGLLTNTAVVSSPDDPRPANDTSSVTAVLTGTPDLVLRKLVDTDSLRAGSTVTYRVIVTNRGLGATTDAVTVLDTLPTWFSVLRTGGTVSGANDGCTVQGHIVTCTQRSPLAAGDSAIADVVARVDSTPATGTITNRACALTVGDAQPANNCSSVTSPVAGGRVLSLSKRSTGTATAGGTATFVLTVRNEGSLPVDGPFTVLDSLPISLRSARAQGPVAPCSVNNQTVQCEHRGTLAAGDSIQFTLTSTVADSVRGTITNCAQLLPVANTSQLRGGRACATVTIEGRPDIAVTVSTNADTLPIGGSARWTVRLRNVGSAPTDGPVTLVDSLGAGLTPVSTDSTTVCTTGGTIVTCQSPRALAVGDSVLMQLTTQVSTGAGAQVTLRACSIDARDAVAENNCAQASHVVAGRRELALSTQAVGTFVVGGEGHLRLWVQNLAGSNVPLPIHVADTLPAGLTPMSASASGWRCTVEGTTVSCDRDAPLAANDSSAIDIMANVTVAALPSATTCSTVSADALLRNAGRACLVITPSGDMRSVVELRTDTPQRELGDVATFSVLMRNPGLLTLTGARLTVQLPAGFAYARGSSARGGKPDASARRPAADPAMVSGRQLQWAVDDLAPGSVQRLDYRVRVLPGVRTDAENVSEAQLVARPVGTLATAEVASNRASASVRVLPSALDQRGVIVGQVRRECRCGGDTTRVTFLTGVRVLMEDGTGAITDAQGKYSFANVRAGLHVVKLDGATLPVGARFEASTTRSSGSGFSRLVDLKDGELQRADFVEMSSDTSGTDTVASPRSAPADRTPFLLTGILQGRIDWRQLRTTPATEPFARFDAPITDIAWTSADGRVHREARGALLLKGESHGNHLTLAFDTERDRSRTLNRDITPNDGFAALGDDAVREFDAQSQQRLYAKLDRGSSTLRFGDFVTPRGDADRQLLVYDRTLTGLTMHAGGSTRSVDAFMAQHRATQMVDELPGRGLSGPYLLGHASVLANSEQVDVVTRDRNQPAVVLSSVPLTRFTDYTLDALSGRLLFRQPVPSTDDELNPVSIRVRYEFSEGGVAFYTYGAAASIAMGRHLSLGGVGVRDEHPLTPLSLYGITAAAKVGRALVATAEVARLESPTALSNTRQGTAWRAEVRQTGERLTARAFALHTDSNYVNPSSALLGGRDEVGGRLHVRLAARSALVGEALHSADARTTGQRDGALVALEQQFTSAISAQLGVRWAQSNGRSVSPSLPTGWSTGGALPGDSAATPSDATSGLAAGSFTALHARVAGRVTSSARLRWFGEVDRGLDETKAYRASLGGDVALPARTRLYLRQEWLSSFAGPFALQDGRSRANTVVGLDAGAMGPTQLFSEYRARDAFSGRDAEARMGLRNRWRVADGVLANTSLERVAPVSGTTPRAGLAITGALAFTQSPSWKGTTRLEWRTGPAGHAALASLGFAQRLSRDWSLLARSQVDVLESKQTREWSQLSMAWRQSFVNRVNALFRVEHHLDAHDATGLPTSRSSATVLATALNLRPAHAVTLSLRYGAKRADDQRDGQQVMSQAQVALARAVWDISAHWDVGVIGSVHGDGGFAQRTYGTGVEVGSAFLRNLRLALGYNVFGYTDRDFTSLGTTQRGPYLEFGYRLDDATFSGGSRKPHPDP
jgi:uncharacterized repeat protein (TIGR01451 family)